MRFIPTRLIAPLLLALGFATALAQGFGPGGGFGGGGGGRRWTRWDPAGWPIGTGELELGPDVKTAREVETRTGDQPVWTNSPAFLKDVFTFARVRYDKRPPPGPWLPRTGGWTTDLPDSDINLAFRLQQLTSMRVDDAGRIIRLTDPELVDYPFLFLSAPGAIWFTDAEATALRKHLLNGGFLLMDDFWGEAEWENCATELKKVFPEREFFELPLSHPLYHGVFEIKAKLQCANLHLGTTSEQTGVTWERPDAHEVHHRAIVDDKGRLMVLALHNTDNGDGWEREGDNDYYFRNFSEKIAYPLGVNIVHYVMTH